MRIKKLLTYTPEFSKRVDNIILYAPFVLAALMFTGCVVYELIYLPLTIELQGSIYSFTAYMTSFLYGCLSSLYGRKYNISLLRSVIYSALCYYLIFMILSQLWCDIDGEVLGTGSIAAFRSVMLLPVLCFLISRFERLDTLSLCDYLVPYYFFGHGLATHGCWIEGCCGGKTMPWGIHHPHLENVFVFPAQPYVIVLSLAIALWGLLYARKKDYQTHGEIFGNSMIIYGFFRYIMEFFTSKPRILGPLSLYAIYALLMILMGFVILQIGKHRSQRYTHSDNKITSTEDLT